MSASSTQARENLAVIEEMAERGRRAAADDGWHLVIWGALASSFLFVQYFAEVRDWAPSSVLWRWQPLFALGCLISLLLGRRSSQRNDITRVYRAAFGATAAIIGTFLVASGALDRPDPLATVVIVAGALGHAFIVTAAVTRIRWLYAVGAAWGGVVGWFGAKGSLEPRDFILLAAAMAALLFAPGVALASNSSRRTMSTEREN